MLLHRWTTDSIPVNYYLLRDLTIVPFLVVSKCCLDEVHKLRGSIAANPLFLLIFGLSIKVVAYGLSAKSGEILG